MKTEKKEENEEKNAKREKIIREKNKKENFEKQDLKKFDESFGKIAYFELAGISLGA